MVQNTKKTEKRQSRAERRAAQEARGTGRGR